MPRSNAITLKLFLVFHVLLKQGNGQWWSFSSRDLKDFQRDDSTTVCGRIGDLSRNQRTLCAVYKSHMPFVGKGARMGAQECEWQLQGERWNCSVIASQNTEDVENRAYEKSNTIGSAEAAFTYAITSAGIVYSIAKACKDGKLKECGCSQRPRPAGIRQDWAWGGCGDNTEYAYGFSKEFIDAKETQSSRNQKDRARRVMNLHNNEVGRLAVVHSLQPTCKCHGVSGSCSLKTCWYQIPDFRTIGSKLKSKYKIAGDIKVNKKGRIRFRATKTVPSIYDLVFVDSSPDYCFKSSRFGVAGTKGRECNETSTGEDGCGKLCCGRGHKTLTIEVETKCNCKFQWCCVVKCQKCKEKIKRHICN